MKKIIISLLILTDLTCASVCAQEPGPGIGIYPTGTETGLGYRSAKDTHWAVDIRITKFNLSSEPRRGALINEASAIYRVAYYEKVRFFIGLGGRAEWSHDKNQSNRFGAVMPLGIEAFPFPFQNAGLFFEAAPYFTTAGRGNNAAGIRTVAGFAFYFFKKKRNEKN